MKGELHLPDLPEVPVALSPLGAAVDAQRRVRPRWTVRLRESAAGYLPLLLMLALALGTWLVAKNTPGLLESPAPGVVKHEPDYTLDRFDLQRFDVAGALKVEIVGEHMQHFPDDDIMEVEKIRVVSIGADGRRLTATALHGRARGDSSEVWLDGLAQVVSESPGQLPVQLNGEHLHALPKLRRVDSASPVVVVQGDSHFEAEGLEYDDETQLLTLHGRVNVLMQPALRHTVSQRAAAKPASKP
jgi:lipopolysaccharide export system protein LptC